MSDQRNDKQLAIWAVIPAAGIGQRMQSTIPKQYLDCAGKPVLQHSIERLLSVERVSGIVVALNAADEHWQSVHIDSEKPVHTLTGGAERADSVRLALEYLQAQVVPGKHDVLALVHDAVRPCVRRQDIDSLIDTVLDSGAGAILASRVKDTMKRTGEFDQVEETVDRENLWHALTPQLFPAAGLLDALLQAAEQGITITDEAAAMETAGQLVRLVESSDSNLKITRPEDLRLAQYYLERE